MSGLWQRKKGGVADRGSAPKAWRWLVPVALAGVCLALAARQSDDESPSVRSVEPPGWWLDHTLNPVRLLISGQHLHQARLKVPKGVKVSNLRRAESGQYLFADLEITPKAKAGELEIEVLTRSGQVKVPFQLMEPARETGLPRGFSSDDVMYLIMPDRFANGDPSNDDPPQSPGLFDRSKPRHYHGGDLRGVQDRLSYLRDLGITTLWLTPWYDNVNHLNRREKYTPDNRLSPDGVPSTDYHGYGAVDFYGVEEHLGSMEELVELCRAARGQGFRMVQDQVANHTGPYHPWATNPPTPTWFNGSADHHLANSWQIWTAAAAHPPADKLKSTLEGWFIDILPDLNQNDPEVSRYLIQNSLWWVGMAGLDGVRQDTLPYAPRSYWARWTSALKRQYPDLTILGELLDGDPELVSFFQGGRARFDGVDSGVDTLFDFPMYFAIRDVFVKGQPMTRLSQTLAADTNYVNPDVLVTFLGLHDVPRFMGEEGATLDGLRQAFTFLLTTRGTPLIYYGDEIGMNGGRDPQNRRDFPGGWPGDASNAFEASGRTAPQESIHAHVRKLLTLRRELPALRQGRQKFLFADAKACAFERRTADESVLVAINNASAEREIELELDHPAWTVASGLTDRLGDLGVVPVQKGRARLRLPARQACVLVPAVALVRSGS
ncbi:MAG: alpha-amylase family glycosyl hydrolase [Verrucomicrobia bacterium]|jgi:glycosidase|nr:alpha-amylase family glycosyl hydrolase [Verrucomicrobiota bacterium]